MSLQWEIQFALNGQPSYFAKSQYDPSESGGDERRNMVACWVTLYDSGQLPAPN